MELLFSRTLLGIKYPVFVAMLLVIFPNTVTAAPSGSDLLYACKETTKSGFDSLEGQMCTWYAAPCDCNVDETLPKVCLPGDLSKEDTARIIIEGLTNDTDLQSQSATEAAIIVLARNYPCQEVK